MRWSTTLRNNCAADIISTLGANAKLEFWNGTVPATGGTPAGTKLATVTFGTVIGTASGGVIDIDEAGITQSAGTFVNGTPTFARFTKSDGTFVMDVDIGAGASNMQFSGTISTGTAIALQAPCTITIGNP
jgi:hypothetical protein